MLALKVVLIGVVATVVTDLWHQLLKLVRLPVANWRFVGRWVMGMRRGVFAHAAISAAAPEPGELAAGWVFHYVVGWAYAALYVAILSSLGEGRPSLAIALLLGAATLAAPWLLKQPAMGGGVAASKSPRRAAALFVSATTHLMFGLGLYLGAVAAERL